MATQTADFKVQMPLRQQAETRLQVGTAPAAKVATTGVDALVLLHRMASDPESANAAIKLLHELQVHQVELDLQHEQTEQTRGELSHALDRYVERHDFAPVGLIALDREGRITEGNLAAAALFGAEAAALRGRRIENLVPPQSRPAVLALLARLCGGSSRETCQILTAGSAPRQLQVVATVAPSDRSFLMALIETGDCK